MSRIPVVIESPFAGCVPLNRAYLEGCIRDALERGETPYASHKMLTDALQDYIPREREMGIQAGLDLRDVLVGAGARVAFYQDLGVSEGMSRSWQTIDENRRETRLLDQHFWGFVWVNAVSDPKFKLVVKSLNRGQLHLPYSKTGPDLARARDVLLDAGKHYVRAY